MKDILKSVGVLIIAVVIAVAIAVAAWHYGNLYGNVYAVIIVLSILYVFVTNIGKKGEAPGEVVAMAIMFVPLMIMVAISVIFSGSETFRMIESGSVVAFMIYIIIMATSEVIKDIKDKKERKKSTKEREIRLEKEKKLYKFKENIIRREVNIDLIKLYKESTEVENRIVGTVLMEGNFSIAYIYLIDEKILKMVIQKNNNYYEYKMTEELVKENRAYDGNKALVIRIIKEFIKEELGMEYKPLIKQHTKGTVRSNFWLVDSNSWVSKDKLFNNEDTVDEIVISKNNKSGEYGILFVYRFFTPVGLSFPISGDDISDRTMFRIEKIESDIKNLKTVLGYRFEAKKLKEIEARYQGLELRGSINSKITIWYNEDEDKVFSFDIPDTLPNIFIPMKHIKELIQDRGDKIEDKAIAEKIKGLRLISHQKEILKMIIEKSKTDSTLKEYFKEV